MAHRSAKRARRIRQASIVLFCFVAIMVSGHLSAADYTTSNPSYPPVWIRIPLALMLGIGSNGVLAWGILNVNNKRDCWGATLIGVGVFMFVGGIGLMLTLGFPATWGWWV
jgi:hypothetical protein